MCEYAFSLSRPLGEVLPREIWVGGTRYPVRADFRTALKLLRLFADPEIAERHKGPLACRIFYGENVPGEGAFEALLDFLRMREGRRDPNAPEMDFEYDADVIWASFRQQYGVDLLREELHWYEFLVLLRGLAEGTALAARLFVRGRDLTGLTGRERVSAEIAKGNAAVPPRVSGEERRRGEEMVRRLLEGEVPL